MCQGEEAGGASAGEAFVLVRDPSKPHPRRPLAGAVPTVPGGTPSRMKGGGEETAGGFGGPYAPGGRRREAGGLGSHGGGTSLKPAHRSLNDEP